MMRWLLCVVLLAVSVALVNNQTNGADNVSNDVYSPGDSLPSGSEVMLGDTSSTSNSAASPNANDVRYKAKDDADNPDSNDDIYSGFHAFRLLESFSDGLNNFNQYYEPFVNNKDENDNETKRPTQQTTGDVDPTSQNSGVNSGSNNPPNYDPSDVKTGKSTSSDVGEELIPNGNDVMPGRHTPPSPSLTSTSNDGAARGGAQTDDFQTYYRQMVEEGHNVVKNKFNPMKNVYTNQHNLFAINPFPAFPAHPFDAINNDNSNDKEGENSKENNNEAVKEQNETDSPSQYKKDLNKSNENGNRYDSKDNNRDDNLFTEIQNEIDKHRESKKDTSNNDYSYNDDNHQNNNYIDNKSNYQNSPEVQQNIDSNNDLMRENEQTNSEKTQGYKDKNNDITDTNYSNDNNIDTNGSNSKSNDEYVVNNSNPNNNDQRGTTTSKVQDGTRDSSLSSKGEAGTGRQLLQPTESPSTSDLAGDILSSLFNANINETNNVDLNSDFFQKYNPFNNNSSKNKYLNDNSNEGYYNPLKMDFNSEFFRKYDSFNKDSTTSAIPYPTTTTPATNYKRSEDPNEGAFSAGQRVARMRDDMSFNPETLFQGAVMKNREVHALCEMRADGSSAPYQVTGVVNFQQTVSSLNSALDPLEVHVQLRGFPGQDNAKHHALLVHEFGDVTKGCGTPGGLFHAIDSIHGDRSGSVRYAGDFGHVQADSKGEVNLQFQDEIAALVGDNSIVGRTLVVHETNADLGRADKEDSGTRVACCVIGFSAPYRAS